MKKLALLLFFILIIASSTFAADVEFTYVGSSCDEEGRGVFLFNIDYEESFRSNEAFIKGFPGEWYDCVEAHCSYDYYDQPPGAPPKNSINSGRQYMLMTEELVFKDSKTYSLELVYPNEVDNAQGTAYDAIDISLECPGYDFSCSLYDFKLDRCESDGSKFRMYITAKGINQPHRVDLIDDFRYRLIGENTQLLEDRPLNEASVKYLGKASVDPTRAEVVSLGKETYYIEFPYGDTAKWLTTKGRYCVHDNDRFGLSSNFEFLEMKKCDVKEFIVTPVKDEPEETQEETPKTTKFFPVPQKETTPKQTAKQVTEEEPEKESTPRREINIFAFFKMLLNIFRR